MSHRNANFPAPLTPAERERQRARHQSRRTRKGWAV